MVNGGGELLTKIRNTGGATLCEGKMTTFLNPYSYLYARRHPDCFLAFDDIAVDGIALVLFLRLFGIAAVRRQSFDMTSLAAEVLDCARTTRRKIFFVGAADGVIGRAVDTIRTAYPSLEICGFRHGYFTGEEEREDVLRSVLAATPDIVVCGMGTGAQEAFLRDLRRMGWQGTGYTCGGFLHQSAAGALRYYPDWADRFHLRWAYRIFREPGLWRRYAFAYPQFVVLFVRDAVRWHLERRGKDAPG